MLLHETITFWGKKAGNIPPPVTVSQGTNRKLPLDLKLFVLFNELSKKAIIFLGKILKIELYSHTQTGFPEKGSVKQFPVSYSAFIFTTLLLNSTVIEQIFLHSTLFDIIKLIRHVAKYAIILPKIKITGDIGIYVTPFFHNMPGGDANIQRKNIIPIKIKFSEKNNKTVFINTILVLYPNAINTKQKPIINLTKTVIMGCKVGKNINNEDKLPTIDASIKRNFLAFCFNNTALDSNKK